MYHFRSSHAGLTKLTHIIDDEEDDFAWGHSECDAREQTKPSTLGPIQHLCQPYGRKNFKNIKETFMNSVNY